MEKDTSHNNTTPAKLFSFFLLSLGSFLLVFFGLPDIFLITGDFTDGLLDTGDIIILFIG
ncbi:hypothetical protein RND71_003099 [Anisodus tanguticus]|uniref:Uncharacterized protein n=1 Tax=Anisodus tanguticus TaxID=243964 RepID=A0AAE1SW55_9SOLA|nr:hypothetical protein RND71_003099 [Anisodus tanguticus]